MVNGHDWTPTKSGFLRELKASPDVNLRPLSSPAFDDDLESADLLDR